MLATLYPNRVVCPQLVAALYAEAARLDSSWRRSCPTLPDDLDSRMVAAVLRELERRQRFHRRPSHRSPRLEQEARALLRLFWQRNARRDCARRHRHGVPCSLDALAQEWSAPGTPLYGADPFGGEAGRAAIEHLVRQEKLRREIAVAVVLHLAGYAWDDIVTLLATLGWRSSHDQVRQWGARYRERCRRSLCGAWS